MREGQPGASALREYDRRHATQERHARETLGGLGVLLSRLIDEPAITRVWGQGGRGEVRTGERLSKHLRGHLVRLLHDRRVPGHGRANIDHMAIGPSGVLVIDTKTHNGKVSTIRVGGLFAPRRTVLLINGREQTHLIDGVERQRGYVRAALGDSSIKVRGALCFPDPEGLPMFSQLSVRDIVIDGPKPIAKLACRPGPLDGDRIDQVWRRLGHAFPPA